MLMRSNTGCNGRLPRWSSGAHDDYRESFARLRQRVEGGLGALLAGLGSGDVAVVFTSSGVIAWLVAILPGGSNRFGRDSMP
jgi:broad specificity phosphatase PhoE